MSAFMVDKIHIDLMVKAAFEGPATIANCSRFNEPYFGGHRLNQITRDELGGRLIAENLRSIQARYPDTIEKPENTPGPCTRYWESPYVYNDPRYRPTAPEILKMISCYEYEACEHAEWSRSEVEQFCEHFRKCVDATLPGYDRAEWEWTEESLKTRKAEIEASQRAVWERINKRTKTPEKANAFITIMSPAKD